MSGSSSKSGESGVDPLFSGTGELATLMRAKDWSATSLGPPAAWDRSLRTVVRIMLTSRYAMWMGWGPELNFFYNDAYRPTLGAKHPWALGQQARQVWAEIWPAIGPRIDTVLQRGEATWDEGLLLFLERNGYPEETYHTFSYSPLPNDAGSTGGMLCVVTEETDRILGERRLGVLRDLASRLAATNASEEVFAALETCLGDSSSDLPFSLTYLFEDGGRRARLASRTGIPALHPAAAAVVEIGDPAARWPFREVATAPIPVTLDQALPWPRGSWPRAPDKALLVPISEQGQTRPAGVFIAGLNVHRPVDEAYRSFIRLFVGQLTAGLANARAYEGERRRSEALAEIDRAKTTFFSNVSHEFRTPLTLMLGPIQDALAERERWSPEDAERWELLHRNGLRLSRLVNALLDFARIEAGRLEASYEPTDLAALTGDLASAFRSAIERAGLRLKVETSPGRVTSYVDREMWEKIVLNLLSNALKFTFTGEIAVALRFDGDHAVLTVADTGVGVPKEELPRLFERFYRVRGSESRTHEGSGIGLALLQELVRLHDGTVGVASTLGKGTTFTVRIPNGGPHLSTRPRGAGDTPISTALATQPFVDEALRWLPPSTDRPTGGNDGVVAIGPAVPAPAAARPRTAARILLADDNADMRQYVARILGETWQVEAVADGETALRAVRARRPDLVLSDVMMPGLDGFGLLRALRDDPATADLPIILLSARAGEDATLEGLGEGANDYLVKPFSSRELIARVAAQLERANAQKTIKEGLEQARATEHQLRQAAEEGSRAKDQFLAMLGHELRNPLAPIVTALHLMRLRGNEQTEKERTVIERQVNHLTRLVDDLLDVSRITQGKVDLKVKTVELCEMVARAIEIAGPIIEQRQHRLTLDVPQRGLALRADPVRLAQVIANLLTNAAKYTEVQGAITVTARREDEQVVLRVRDNGIGMTAAMLPKVFDLFAQEWQASDRSHGGLGLGLSIVRNLVALHGGTVEAHSEGLGCGSEFVVRLPALRVENRVDDQPADLARRDSGARTGRSILVVDDNEDVADMLAQMLEHLGHVVRVVHDGPAALALPDDFIPDLALLDIGLPVMDGYELARRLRERPALKNLTLVAVTGYGQESDRKLSREAGFDAHLVKPVDPGRLEAIVKQLTDAPKG